MERGGAWHQRGFPEGPCRRWGQLPGAEALTMGLPSTGEGAAAASELPKHALLKPQIPTPSDLFQTRATSW